MQTDGAEVVPGKGWDFRRCIRSGGSLALVVLIRTCLPPPPRCYLCCAVCPAPWALPSPASAPPLLPRLSGRCYSPCRGRASGLLGSSACAQGLRGGPASCVLASPAPVVAASCIRKVSVLTWAGAVSGTFLDGMEGGGRVGHPEPPLEVQNIFPVIGSQRVKPTCDHISLHPSS